MHTDISSIYTNNRYYVYEILLYIINLSRDNFCLKTIYNRDKAHI